MNETLAATARALFQSWFVDFDPVHHKSRGEQPPGMDADTAALFPDSFEESALGLIPSGWEVEPLSNHIHARKGLSYKGDGLVDIDTGMPMHNLNSVYEGGGYKYEGIKYYSGEYQERHIAKAGDVIVTNTEQGHDLLLIGYPALIPHRYEVGLFSHHIYRVVPLQDSHITPRFIYFLFRTDFFHEVIGGYTNGTTVNMLPSDALERPLFVVPPPELMGRFDEIIVPMLDLIEQNYEQTQQLTETRDALLPKLVSGEIRVGDIEYGSS
jgi:type I restriction enzyme S subunit